MVYVMYVFVNKRLNMTHGKMAVQVGHAVVYSIRMSDPDVYETWFNNLQIKIVLQAENETHLKQIAQDLDEKGIRTQEVHDAGLTELEPNSFTALAVQILEKDKVKEIFKNYKSYRI